MEVILFLIIFSYSGMVDANNPRITSGFGDFRRRAVFHYHPGIDIGVKYGTEVKYPEGEDSYYKATIVSIKYGHNSWPNQTTSFILGRFDFTHLLDGTNKKDSSYAKPSKKLLEDLGIPEKKRSDIAKWKDLWTYCSKSKNIDTTTGQCVWKGGYQVGYVSRGNKKGSGQHLHFGELLIPNKAKSENLWINPLWEFTGTLEFNNGTYLRYGNYEDVSDTIQPANTSVAERVNPSYPGYMTMDSVSSSGVWDSDVWIGGKRDYTTTNGLKTVDLITEWVHYFYDKVPDTDSLGPGSFWWEDSVWCQVVGTNGHKSEVEIVGRPLDHINSVKKVIPFELKGAITPYKIQERLGRHFDIIKENAHNFGTPVGGNSYERGYAWTAFKFDTINGSKYNDNPVVLKFYYDRVKFKNSTSYYYTTIHDSVKYLPLPQKIGSHTTYKSNLAVFYTDISHNYRQDTHYVNIAASKVCKGGYSSVPCPQNGSNYKEFYYPDGIYYFWKIEKDVEGEDDPNRHSESSRCAVIVDNYDPTWFLEARVDLKPNSKKVFGSIVGEANEPIKLPRYVVDTTTPKPRIKLAPLDSFVKINSIEFVEEEEPHNLIWSVCQDTACKVAELVPGLLSRGDLIFSSPHISIITQKYDIPDDVFQRLTDSTKPPWTTRISFTLRGFRDLAGNLLAQIDTSILGEGFVGDTDWYYYYYSDSTNTGSFSSNFDGMPSPHSNGNTDAVQKIPGSNKQYESLGIFKVYDAGTRHSIPYELAHRYAIQLVKYSVDNLKADSIYFLGFGFSPTIVSDSISFFITYSFDSITLDLNDTLIPLIKPVIGEIRLYSPLLQGYGDTSGITPRVIYNNQNNTSILALGPVATIMVNGNIYIAFEEYWSRRQRGRHCDANGTVLRLLKYNPYVDSVSGVFTLDSIMEVWEFNTPEDIKRAIDTLKSASIGAIDDSILYIAWCVNRKDTGIFRVYRINIDMLDTLRGNLTPVYTRVYPGKNIANPHLSIHNYEINVLFTLSDGSDWHELNRYYTQEGSPNHMVERLFDMWDVKSYRSDGRRIILSANPYGYADLRYSIYPYDTLYLLKDFYDVTQPGLIQIDTTYYATFVSTDGIFGYNPGISSIPIGNNKVEYKIILGGKQETPYTIYREGYMSYKTGDNILKTISRKITSIFNREAKHVSKSNAFLIVRCSEESSGIHQIDYGDSLVYEIRGISAQNYRLHLTAYQEEERRVIEFVSINNIPMGVLQLKRGKERTIRRRISKWLVRNGKLRIKVRKLKGQKAYLESIVLEKIGHHKDEIQAPNYNLSFSVTVLPDIIPRNSRCAIKLSLPEKDRLLIRVYDIQGRKVKTIANKVFERGTHLIGLDAHELHSGIYFLYVKSNTHSRKVVRKFMVLK